VETPVVYNRALDDVGPKSRPRCILIADNPGKNGQKAENQRYLVGQSGRLAEGFFRRELGRDFRAEVLIINKTPVHTPKTAAPGAPAAPPGFRRRTRLLEGEPAWMAGFALSCTRRWAVPYRISGNPS
jgi:hypothetical protein